MSRLLLICGEALLLADDGASPERASVAEAAAEALARFAAASVTCVLVSDPPPLGPSARGGEAFDPAALARLHERIRDGLARRGARLESILVPSAPLTAAFGRALERYRAAPTATPVLCETLAALEAAAALACPRILLRTRAGRAVQAAGLPEALLPVGVQADLTAAVGPALRILR